MRILLFGYPGTPIFEIGEALSEFYRMNFFTIEDRPEMEDTYFRDKIPSHRLDTGDFTTGSGSSHMSRDISAGEKDRELDQLYVPEIDNELDGDEFEEIAKEESGILVTEVPDIDLLDWATHIIFFKANWDVAVEWFAARRKCPSCGNVHHLIEKPPRYDGICDRCGTGLIRKPEDDPKVLAEIYQNWRSAFSIFETKVKGKKYWKIINTDECADFDEIMTKVARWLKESGMSGPATNHTPRTDHKNWFPKGHGSVTT